MQPFAVSTAAAVVICSIQQGDMSIEGELDNGLIVGHAYSVTDAKAVCCILTLFID